MNSFCGAKSRGLGLNRTCGDLLVPTFSGMRNIEANGPWPPTSLRAAEGPLEAIRRPAAILVFLLDPAVPSAPLQAGIGKESGSVAFSVGPDAEHMPSMICIQTNLGRCQRLCFTCEVVALPASSERR